MPAQKKSRSWWPIFTGAVFVAGAGMGLLSFVERTHARPYVRNIVREETAEMQTDIRQIRKMLEIHCGDSVAMAAKQKINLWGDDK